MTLTPGTKLGPYEIISPIGAGGMGEVYRARDTRLGREVALKVLPESFSRDADRLRRFEQEARAVAALNHPNILAIHDIGEQNGAPFIVSELLEGNTLRAELEHGALSPRKASDYAVQIAQGLAAAHDKNIIHRDLKPENIFISREGRVKILDFGLAKLATNASGPNAEAATFTVTSSPTEAGVVMGTAGYMAPEQVRGLAVDSRTDIFAFGAVLYEMVSGRRAFRRETSAETMTAILKDDPPELNEPSHPVPPGLERIVRRCLEKQPEQRFQSAKDLAFALDTVSGTSASNSVATAALDDHITRRGWLTPAISALIGMAIVAAIAFYLRPAAVKPAVFSRVSFHRGQVIRARLAPDGKSVFYSAKLNGTPADTYVVRQDYPESVPVGLHGGLLLSISQQGQMALLVRPVHYAHYQWSGTLATAPTGGGSPREILENVYDADWSPDGSELAVIDRDQTKWRVQYPIGKTILELDNWLTDLRVSPDGQSVAVLRHPPNPDDRGDVIVVDRSGQVRTVSTGWESVEGLAWSASGKEVWFSAAESGEQYCVHAANLSGQDRTVHCGTAATRIHDVSASGRALLSTEDHRVTMVVVQHGSGDERDLSWLDAPSLPFLSDDGSEMLFTDQSGMAGTDYAVYVRKTDGSPAVRIGGGGFGSAISPDGKLALIALPGDLQGRIQIVSVGPGQARMLSLAGFTPQWARWFHDGVHILLSASEAGKSVSLYVTDVSGATPKMVSSGFTVWAGASPDGKSIYTMQNGDWVVKSLTDGSSKPIPGVHNPEYPISFAADSKYLYTQSPNETGLTIYKVNADTGAREVWQVIKPKEQIGLAPISLPTGITPDGKWIAFTYGTDLGQLYRSDTLK